jgi:exonuclease III
LRYIFIESNIKKEQMMTCSLFFLLLWVFLLATGHVVADTECPIVMSPGSDRRTDTTKLRLVQYNVEWLFVDYYSPMNCPGNGCTWANQSEALTHMDYVAKVVHDLNPDIINFCEVEGCDELSMLHDRLEDESYRPYLKKGTDSSTGQNVGLLTRIDPLLNLFRTENKVGYPVLGSECGYTGSVGTSGVSKHYITEFQFGGYPVAFIAAHLLAIPTDPARCAQREAQATVLQDVIADYVRRGYEVIVVGDFNDYDNEVLDVNNNHPTSHVLDILKGMWSNGEYRLENVAEDIPQSERFSDWWDSDNDCNTESLSDYSMIDHVLVTKGIKNHLQNVFLYHGYTEYCGKYNSDHYPLVIDFAL